MKILERHEQFEMLVLDEMRKIKILDQIAFGGGTMLRLCFELPRFSGDLNFYLQKGPSAFLPWAKRLSKCLRRMGAEILDEREKHFSFLWEIRLGPYPRRLKVEIRKESDQARKTEINIAHSAFSPLQVRLRALNLEQMWENKIRALAERHEIRDAYDLEFLTRRRGGDFNNMDQKILRTLSLRLEGFSSQDFKSKLGAVLPDNERERVLSSRFSYLKAQLAGALR